MDRTRKVVGKTLVCQFGVTEVCRGLEGGSPIERSEASSEISLPPQHIIKSVPDSFGYGFNFVWMVFYVRILDNR